MEKISPEYNHLTLKKKKQCIVMTFEDNNGRSIDLYSPFSLLWFLVTWMRHNETK